MNVTFWRPLEEFKESFKTKPRQLQNWNLPHFRFPSSGFQVYCSLVFRLNNIIIKSFVHKSRISVSVSDSTATKSSSAFSVQCLGCPSSGYFLCVCASCLALCVKTTFGKIVRRGLREESARWEIRLSETKCYEISAIIKTTTISRYSPRLVWHEYDCAYTTPPPPSHKLNLSNISAVIAKCWVESYYQNVVKPSTESQLYTKISLHTTNTNHHSPHKINLIKLKR